MTHPLTDKFLTQFGVPTDEFLIQFGIPDDQCVEGERVFFEEDIRAAADWQLKQVLRWFQFDYGTDPNLSRERKMRGGFKEISTALEKAMRPTQENN